MSRDNRAGDNVRIGDAIVQFSVNLAVAGVVASPLMIVLGGDAYSQLIKEIIAEGGAAPRGVAFASGRYVRGPGPEGYVATGEVTINTSAGVTRVRPAWGVRNREGRR